MDKDNTDAEEQPSVVWEKQFQQTILVDISDNDDSLHFSHLQSSFTLHVSHSVAESNENSGLSSSSKIVEDSSKSLSSINSRQNHYNNLSDLKGHKINDSDSQPDTLPQQTRWMYKDDSTSDEDQEELPYDGDHYHCATHCSRSLRQSSEEQFNLIKKCNQSPDAFNNLRKDATLAGGGIANTSCPVSGQKPNEASVPGFLLRHFSHDELFNCSRLIEAETMPEVSLMDSINETTRRDSLTPHNTTEKHRKNINTSLLESNRVESCITLEVTETSETMTHKNDNADIVLGQLDSSEKSKVYSSPGTVSVASEDEKDEEQCNVKQSCSSSLPNLHQVDIQTVKYSLGTTWSCSELEYGQGQVHEPLLDFSKVPPNVEFHRSNDIFETSRNSVVTTAQTTPVILNSPCKADVINRVLEDSNWLTEKPKVFKDEISQSTFDQDLQMSTLSESTFSNFLGKKADDTQHTKDNTRVVQHTFLSSKAGLDEEKRDRTCSATFEQKNLTEGERLTIELKDIINQFMVQIEEFKICISNMSMPAEEQQMVFKSMMEAQDQLQGSYMCKKEEHRALEMQNYMGHEWNTGEFDPDRSVEGAIFQLGMQLEDIKEQIDRNVYRVLSPSPSWTTPNLMLHGEHILSSPQPALYKESEFRSSSKNSIMDEEEESCKESYEVPQAVDSSSGCLRENSLRLCIYNQSSCPAMEDEERGVRVSAEDDNYNDFQAQQSNPLLPQHQRTPTSDAIHALQNEVSCLKRLLEESLSPLPYRCIKSAHLSNMRTHERRLRALPHKQHQYRQVSESRYLDTNSYTAEDRISSTIEKYRGASDHTEIPDVFILTPRSRHTHSSSPTNRMSNDLTYSLPASLENLSLDTSQSQGDNYRRASVATTSTGSNTVRNPIRFGLPSHSRKNKNTGYVKSYYTPLTGFEEQNQQSEPKLSRRRCSIQSDSALLPSNTYFYRASSLPTCPNRTGGEIKEEALNQAIDKALGAALLMKQITDHMAKTLSSDLAKAQLHKKLRQSERETA